MRTYLATLHKKSDKHKKRFALVTAGSFTLLIFAIWALVRFGGSEITPANANQSLEGGNPFGPLWRGMQAGFEMIRGVPGDFENEIRIINTQGNYGNPENNLNTYDQPR